MGPRLLYVIALAMSIPVSDSSIEDFKRLTRAESEDLNEICGKSFVRNHPRGSVQRVARGSLVRQGEFPWAVFLLTDLGGCSGSIISKYHIITAAHCVIINQSFPGNFSVDFENSNVRGGSPCAIENAELAKLLPGIYDSSPDRGCTWREYGKPQTLKIKRIIVPRSSLSTKMEDELPEAAVPDIAILELDHPISDTDNEMLPICVPGISTSRPQMYSAYGFGSTENGINTQLLKLNVENYTLHYINECASKWNDRERCIQKVIFLLEDKDGSMCRGDSGGALSGFADGKDYLFGVISGGTGVNCNYSSLQNLSNVLTITKVASYSDFLCFYTGVCPLGYDVYNEKNYAKNPEPVLFFDKEGGKKSFDEGDFVVPVRKEKAEPKWPDDFYEEEWPYYYD